jgi:hypothetical protein
MNKWIKEGLINGTHVMMFFVMFSFIWALIIKLSENSGISPGWSMLAFIVIAIFSLSLASAKTKYDLEQKFGGKE